jgi:hypothetical protein
MRWPLPLLKVVGKALERLLPEPPVAVDPLGGIPQRLSGAPREVGVAGRIGTCAEGSAGVVDSIDCDGRITSEILST